DTWPPTYLFSYVYAWPPLGRVFAWLYPVVAQPMATLLEHVAQWPPWAVALGTELGWGETFLTLAFVNAIVWMLVILAVVGVSRFHRRHRPNAVGSVTAAVAFVGALAIVSCTDAPASRGPAPATPPTPGAEIEYLLTSAAEDFQAHPPPHPIRFRDVRGGYV